MSLQLANYKDLEQIVKIEKDTNEHPWSLNNFKSSLDAGNSSIVLKKENRILGYAFFFYCSNRFSFVKHNRFE